MKQAKPIKHVIRELLELARFAPSVHNTQPWRVSASDNSVLITVDDEHKLGAGDPSGRQTTISLGIFSEALIVAADSLGYKMASIELGQDSAHIEFSFTNKPSTKLAQLLKHRCTDRSIYKKTEITESTVQDISNTALIGSTTVMVRTDKALIDSIANLTAKGIGLALSNPAFRAELSQYLTLPWAQKQRGISVLSLYIPWPIAILQPILVRLGSSSNKEAALEKKRWQSASAVVLILADGDLEKQWFEAGRTYLRASLAIEASDLSQATSAAIVEASNYHEDIEEALGTNQRILALIRIGRGAKKRRYSPRLSVDQLLH